MKVLIAYDGSESADTAIDGLRRARLPIRAFFGGKCVGSRGCTRRMLS
jgi:hypothetical protein